MRKAEGGMGSSWHKPTDTSNSDMADIYRPQCSLEAKGKNLSQEACMDLHESGDLTWVPLSVNLKHSLKFP